MNGEQLGRALAYAMGDFRDWPMRCWWCGSERVVLDVQPGVLHCERCRRSTPEEVAHEERKRRARCEVISS